MNNKFEVQKFCNNHYFISNDYGKFVLKNGKISSVANSLIGYWWETKKEATIFLAGWLLLNRNFSALYELEHKIDLSQVDKEQQYPLGMKYKDAFGVTWTYYHKVKPKPYQFKPGDVVEMGSYKRIIVKTVQGQLQAISIDNGEYRSSGQKAFEGNGYKKIGELKDYIK